MIIFKNLRIINLIQVQNNRIQFSFQLIKVRKYYPDLFSRLANLNIFIFKKINLNLKHIESLEKKLLKKEIIKNQLLCNIYSIISPK
jgi:hypothetical protein